MNRDKIALSLLPVFVSASLEAARLGGTKIDNMSTQEINDAAIKSAYVLADQMLLFKGRVRPDINPKNHRSLYSVEFEQSLNYISIVSHDGLYVNVPISGAETYDQLIEFFNGL